MYVVELDTDGKVQTSYFKDLTSAGILCYNYLRYYATANKYPDDNVLKDALANLDKLVELQDENPNLEIKIPCIDSENGSIRISLKVIEVSEYIVSMKLEGEIPIRVFAPDEDVARVEADKMLKYQDLNMLTASSTEIIRVEKVNE